MDMLAAEGILTAHRAKIVNIHFWKPLYFNVPNKNLNREVAKKLELEKVSNKVIFLNGTALCIRFNFF